MQVFEVVWPAYGWMVTLQISMVGLWVAGYVTDLYQRFWLKHQTSMGQNEFKFEKFVVTYFKLCEFGEKQKY
jgi:hypothetical protein